MVTASMIETHVTTSKIMRCVIVMTSKVMVTGSNVVLMMMMPGVIAIASFIVVVMLMMMMSVMTAATIIVVIMMMAMRRFGFCQCIRGIQHRHVCHGGSVCVVHTTIVVAIILVFLFDLTPS